MSDIAGAEVPINRCHQLKRTYCCVKLGCVIRANVRCRRKRHYDELGRACGHVISVGRVISRERLMSPELLFSLCYQLEQTCGYVNLTRGIRPNI